MKSKQKYLIFAILMVLFTTVIFSGCASNVNAADSIIVDIFDNVSPFQTDSKTDSSLPSLLQGSTQTTEEKVIALVLADPRAVAYLEHFPGWTAEAYEEDGDIWGVDVFDADGEWQGYAQVNIVTEEILELYAPEPLSPEERQAGQDAVKSLVFADAEVLALLGDPERWEYSIDYERFEDLWKVYFYRGLDAWDVSVYQDDGKFSIDQIVDANQMEAQQARRWAQDQAIELAYSVEGVWDKLDGIDDWYTYAENQGGSVWSVTFSTKTKISSSHWLTLTHKKFWKANKNPIPPVVCGDSLPFIRGEGVFQRKQ